MATANFKTLFISAVLAWVCASIMSSCAEPLGSNKQPRRKSVRFFLYGDASNPWRREELMTGDLTTLKQSHYNASRPVKILVHAWTQVWYLTPFFYPVSTKNAYLKYGPECNVIIVDYHRVRGFWNYFKAASGGMQEVMETAGEFFAWLHRERRINLKTAHISGLSLGGPVAAAIAHATYQMTGVKMGRITGLDPPSVGFSLRVPFFRVGHHITPDDADFVDILHTNGARIGLGNTMNVGHADFHVNGGMKQPNKCFLSSNFCSHVLSAYYFEKSIRTGDRTERCACTSLAAYRGNPACCETRVVLGEYANPRHNGSFYMEYKLNFLKALGEILRWG